MNKLFKILLITPLFGLAACKDVKTPDGKIPADYVDEAQAYMGTYDGKFDGRRGTITLSLNGDRPVVQFNSDSGSNDIAGNNCNSEVGQLESVDIDKKKDQYELDSATFSFHPGNCFEIQGRELTLSFKHKKGQPYKMSASIFYREEQDYNPPNCFDQYGRPYPCNGNGNRYPVYLNGSFKKTK